MSRLSAPNCWTTPAAIPCQSRRRQVKAVDNTVDNHDDDAAISRFDVPHLRVAGMVVLAFVLVIIIAAMVGVVKAVHP